MEKEIWKLIKNYNNYEISNLGNVRKSDTKIKIEPCKLKNNNTRTIIRLSKNNKRKSFQLDLLVAEAFIPNNYNSISVIHKDGNLQNNNASNLEWFIDPALKWLDKIPDRKEVWKDVIGWEDIYEISNIGRIRIKDTGKIKKDHIKPNSGYHQINLEKGNIRKTISIHRLVAETFIPNPNNLSDVNHIDGDKNNNTITNLEWLSHADNIRHGFKNNLYDINEHTKRCIKNNKKYEKNTALIDPITKEIKFKGTVIECANFVGLKSRGSYCSKAIKEEKEYKGYIWKRIKKI